MAKYCRNCGLENVDDADFCSACGSSFDGKTPAVIIKYVEKPKTPGKGFGITSLVLGIVGTVYALLALLYSAIFLMIPLFASQSGDEMPEEFSFFILMVVLIYTVFPLIMAVLTLIFGIISRKKGYKCGISTSGVVLGGITIGLVVLCYVAASIIMLA